LLQGENPPFWAKDFHSAPAVAQEPVAEVTAKMMLDQEWRIYAYKVGQVMVGTKLYTEPPAVAVNEQMQCDAARFEYLEQFTKCIKTPNGDLAWTIQLQQVLVGDTFGKAVDAAIEAAKKGGV